MNTFTAYYIHCTRHIHCTIEPHSTSLRFYSLILSTLLYLTVIFLSIPHFPSLHFYRLHFASLFLTVFLKLHILPVIPGRLVISRLLKKFPAFYETWCFIAVFTRARHLSICWPRSVHAALILYVDPFYYFVSAYIFDVVSIKKHGKSPATRKYALHTSYKAFCQTIRCHVPEYGTFIHRCNSVARLYRQRS
jgi:hypothetical protein